MPLVTFPRTATLTQAPRFLVTSTWVAWLSALWRRVSVGHVHRTDAAAAITAEAIPLLDGNEPLVRISWVLRLTQAATVSSSAQLTFAWTDGGQAMSAVQSAVTGNTVTSGQTGTLLVRHDPMTDVTVAMTYASSGATPMTYDLDVISEAR